MSILEDFQCSIIDLIRETEITINCMFDSVRGEDADSELNELLYFVKEKFAEIKQKVNLLEEYEQPED